MKEILNAECGMLSKHPDHMSNSRLNLVVIRVGDLEKAYQFYSALGLKFAKHAHGSGPEHYAAEEEGVVFEIYSEVNENSTTKNVRLGFKVQKVEEILLRLNNLGGKILSPAKSSPWGIRAVVEDPFGHKIELVA